MSRNELLPFLDEYQLEIPDRRIKQDVVEALASSRKARLEDILATRSRDALEVGQSRITDSACATSSTTSRAITYATRTSISCTQPGQGERQMPRLLGDKISIACPRRSDAYH